MGKIMANLLHRVKVGNENKEDAFKQKHQVFHITLKRTWKPISLLKRERPAVCKALSLLVMGLFLQVKLHVYVPFKKYFVEMRMRFIHFKSMATLHDEYYIPLKDKWVRRKLLTWKYINRPGSCRLLLGLHIVRLSLLPGT